MGVVKAFASLICEENLVTRVLEEQGTVEGLAWATWGSILPANGEKKKQEEESVRGLLFHSPVAVRVNSIQT